jgi:hypothetical protein
MRSGVDAALALDLQHRFQGAVSGGAAGAEGHGEILGPQGGEARARLAQALGALLVLGREEFETEYRTGIRGLVHAVSSKDSESRQGLPGPGIGSAKGLPRPLPLPGVRFGQG